MDSTVRTDTTDTDLKDLVSHSTHLKIDTAAHAWATPSFYLPNKQELITDFILTRLLKLKSTNPPSNPILDARYWSLLHDILSSSSPRPLKSWLLPILNRTPFAPIAIAFFSLLPSTDSAKAHNLAGTVRKCFDIIWPLAVQKITSDSLLECFGAVLNVAGIHQADDDLRYIFTMVTTSFRTSLGNANPSSKKKLYLTFLQTHFQSWLESTSLQGHPVYETGVDILFNPDILRLRPSSLFTHIQPHTLLLPLLPRLFTSYTQALKKHRNTLFNPSKAEEEVRVAGMTFLKHCLDLLSGGNEVAWKARAGLLDVVDGENLALGREEIVGNVELAVGVLESLEGGEKIHRAINVLSALARIDHDLVAPSIPRILHTFLSIPTTPDNPAYKFLHHLLDFHTKTRTMHTYIHSLLTSLHHPPPYQTAWTSPLLDSRHLDRLARAIHGFLTPGQVGDVVRGILGGLKVGVVDEACDGHPRKHGRGEVVVCYVLTCAIASIVLSSLPLHSLTGEVRGLIGDVVGVIRGKRTKERDDEVVWAASLRLEYALRAARILDFKKDEDMDVDGGEDQREVHDLMDVNIDEVGEGELQLEIFRTLLAQISLATPQSQASAQTTIHKVLSYLEGHLDTDTTWTGRTCHLASKPQTALALLWLVVERWLPLFDEAASPEQLDRSVQLFMGIPLGDVVQVKEKCNEKEMEMEMVCPKMCVMRALRSAEFWELGNLRAALLSYLNAQSSILDSISVSNQDQPISFLQSQLGRALCSYEFLLFVPIEYLSKASRSDLVRRAIIADRVVLDIAKQQKEEEEGKELKSLTVLRVCLKRVFGYLGGVDHSMVQEYMIRLINSPCYTGVLGPAAQYTSVTLDLVEGHLLTLLRSNTQAALNVVQSFLPSNDETKSIKSACLMKLISLLAKEFKSTDFSEDIFKVMVQLQERLSSGLLPRVSSMEDTLHRSDLLLQWCHAMSFGRWLGLQKNSTMPIFGQRLVARLMAPNNPFFNDPHFEDVCVATYAVLLEELHASSESERLARLDLTIAAYLSLCRLVGEKGQGEMDIHTANACKLLSVTDFSHLMDLILEFLSNTQSNEGEMDTCNLIHLSVLLLHGAPQGTLKVIQAFTTQLLNLLAGQSRFSQGLVSIRLQVVGFVSKHCSDRPAALRLLDLNSIWSLLAKFLQKSSDHDSTTSPAIFHSIVSILSALIRLRRDLVIHTLPHLGMLLSQLISSLRSLRPQLGGKQSKIVTNTLPRWINASSSQPLGAEEAKSLSRLLSTLTTKTIVRTHHQHTSDTSKAESLAKPFSKHAAYVLKAYIDAMNDPLCVLSSEIRKELMPGLFALCDMVTEHARDALMVSGLDGGGKATLKVLWREYEKQRYVGKG